MAQKTPRPATMIVYTKADGRAGKTNPLRLDAEHRTMVNAWLAADDVEFLIIGSLGDAAGNVLTLGAVDLNSLLNEVLPDARSLLAFEAVPQSSCVALGEELHVTVDSRWNELKAVRLAN